MRRSKVVMGMLAAAAIFGATSVRGEEAKPAGGGGAAPSGAELYQQRTCVACHGKDAKSPLLPEYPRLAGQNAAYAARQMQDIKSGARANGNTAAMKGIMHLVSDQEIEVLAAWLEAQK